MISTLAIVEDRQTYRVVSDVLSNLCTDHNVCFKTEDYVNTIKAGEYNLLLLDLDIFTINEIENIKRDRPDLTYSFILSTSNIKKLTEYEDTFNEKILYTFKPIKADPLAKKIKCAFPTNIATDRDGSYFSDVYIGEHPSIVAFNRRIDFLEKTTLPIDSILILGETGVGKEIYARYIHQKLRPDKRFFAVNCGAITPNLLEEELFGHEKGVFTSAHEVRKGILEEYSDGTVFFDEFAELDMQLQSKFLRILEDRLIRRIGSNKFIKCNSLFVFATNRDLEEDISQKKFRLDLFHRINRITFRIPALRERKMDIASLANFLIANANKKYNRHLQLDDHVIEFFESCIWKGNIREMKNILENLVCFADSDATIIQMDDLPTSFFRQQEIKNSDDNSESERVFMLDNMEGRTLDDLTVDFQRIVIERVMRGAENRKGLAAKKLGLSRFQLYRYLKQLNLESGTQELMDTGHS
ncbi:MAG: sigma 54-interacting transcriptional regulator [Desulfobacterales bacterium]|nr:sigma 54-interacting transcriptional regulator [Desulfobacterales bacterium]